MVTHRSIVCLWQKALGDAVNIVNGYNGISEGGGAYDYWRLGNINQFCSVDIAMVS